MKILFRQKLFIALFSILSLTLLLSQAQAATKAKSKAAQKERLVLLPMDISAESRAMYGQQESAVVEGLAQKYEVFSGERVMQELRKAASKESSRAKGNCDETRCLEDVAIALQTENVAMVHVTKTEGGYLLSISIKNVMTNQAVFDKSLPCEGCSVFKVIDKLKELGGAQAAVAIAPAAEAPQAKLTATDLESSTWAEAQKGNTADDYQVYLDAYPKGKYVLFAKAKIKKLKEAGQALAEQQEQQAWGTAQQENSEASLNRYLQAYPSGRFAGFAKSRLSKLKVDLVYKEETELWQRAESGNDKVAVENYLNKYPAGRYVAAATSKLQAIAVVRQTPVISESRDIKVVATDGTKKFSNEPLVIEVVKFNPIFSNTYKLYEANGVGLVRLTNNTSSAMDGVTLSFHINDFTDFPTESKIDKLEAGQTVEVILKPVFNNNILVVAEDVSIQATVETRYLANGKQMVISKEMTTSVYEKHKMRWREAERFASFITPRDASVVAFTGLVTSAYKDIKDQIQLATLMFDALGVHGLTYIPDPTNPYQIGSLKPDEPDYIQFPRETLERKSGDCDDLVAAYSSVLEKVGIATRVLRVPGHMFMMFSTGVPASADGYTMDEMYVIQDNMLWIPVETTVVGNSFIKAWELGAGNYYKWKNKGLTVLNIQQAWASYKPVTLPTSTWVPNMITKQDVDKKFPNEEVSIAKISSHIKARNFH